MTKHQDECFAQRSCPKDGAQGHALLNDRNLAASVRARLLNRARETRQAFNLILTRYALERVLTGSASPPTPISSC